MLKTSLQQRSALLLCQLALSVLAQQPQIDELANTLGQQFQKLHRKGVCRRCQIYKRRRLRRRFSRYLVGRRTTALGLSARVRS